MIAHSPLGTTALLTGIVDALRARTQPAVAFATVANLGDLRRDAAARVRTVNQSIGTDIPFGGVMHVPLKGTGHVG